MKTLDLYVFNVKWSHEDQLYVGTAEEFKSLSWLSETPEGALLGIRNLVSSVLIDMDGSEYAIK